MLVEVLTLLEQHDELLAQAAHHLGLLAGDVDLVAAHDHRRRREGLLDEAQVRVALTHQTGHEVRAWHDDGIRLRERRHTVGPGDELILLYGSESSAGSLTMRPLARRRGARSGACGARPRAVQLDGGVGVGDGLEVDRVVVLRLEVVHRRVADEALRES